jgi:hypothetical protein
MHLVWVRPDPPGALTAPGATVQLGGFNFGDVQGSGYVRFADNGNNRGAPGDPGAISIVSWSATMIEFLVPSSAADLARMTIGSTGAVVVANSVGLVSGPKYLPLQVQPVLTGISPQKAGPGDLVTLTGQHFGAHSAQEVRFTTPDGIWFLNFN